MKANRIVIALCAVVAVVGAAEAANSIDVTPAAALNGTNYGLAVTVDGTAGEAVVISQHPQSEQSFNVSMYVNPNNLTLCAGTECRLWFGRTFGNRGGVFKDAFRIGMKKTATGFYRALVWVKDENSTNPGAWEQVGEFFFGSATTAHKITVEWQAATGNDTDDGSISVYKDDVLVETVSNIDNPFEVDNSRIGHAFGAVKAGAIGTYYLDEYVSTR